MRDERGVPECLNRRYKAVDQLIDELSSMMSGNHSELEDPGESTKDPGLKLMCDFWSILKQDPSCNLPHVVQQKMCCGSSASTTLSEYTHPRSYTCYMAHENRKPAKTSCPDPKTRSESACCTSTPKGSTHNSNDQHVPLSKVLCNLKDAASFDKKCTTKLNELVKTEKYLQGQIQVLENREAAGVKMLKQADCMWSCMEDAYKQKIAESLDRQKEFTRQLREVEKSAAKWRKNKKDLESQLDTINKCHIEITDKINQKTNDNKCMDMEIEGLKKRIDANRKSTDEFRKSLSSKKQASDGRMAVLAKDINAVQKAITEHQKLKQMKEDEVTKYVKEARDDLQQLCKVLLQKKLENEDLIAEKTAMINEIKMLEASLAGCKERCRKKQDNIYADIKKVDVEIANFKIQCVRCHQCTDTDDIRKFCTDCPRCLAERDCIYTEDHCDPDHTTDCVCQTVKTKFLDNIFENMYTVLERQVKSGPGKAVAESVLRCLQKSRNGKLNAETKQILQDFILTTVKKNLNLTIVGGAVKTRCELDPETYKQLMLCLKKVKAPKPPKSEKGTNAKKEPCTRWGGASECFCPKGPKACVCTKRAPPPANDPTPCPADPEDQGEREACPHKDAVKCGADCGMHSLPSSHLDGTNVGQWRPDPCQGPSCAFTKDTRAARCVLGESATSLATPSFKTAVPFTQSISVLGDQIVCKCGKTHQTPCTGHKDRRSQPRRKIIEEVMGQYIEVPLIEKVLDSGSSSIYASLTDVKLESDGRINITDVMSPLSGSNVASENLSSPTFSDTLRKLLKINFVDEKQPDRPDLNYYISKLDRADNFRVNKDDSELTRLYRDKKRTKTYINAPILVSKTDILKNTSKENQKPNKHEATLLIKVSKNDKVNEVIKDVLKTELTYKNLKIISSVDDISGTATDDSGSSEKKTNTNYAANDKHKKETAPPKKQKIHAKRLKADPAKDCDKDTCDELFIDFEADNVIEPKKAAAEVKFEDTEPVEDQAGDINVPSVQKDVFERSLKDSGTEAYVKVPHFEEPTIITDGWTNTNHNDIAELKTNMSGTLIMDLSEDLISKYLTKNKFEPNDVPASLIETESGRVLVNFHPDPTNTCLINMKVHRSRSGKITLEIDKNLVKSLHANIRISELRPSLSIKIKESGLVRSARELDECNHIKGADTKNEHDKYVREILEDIIYLDDKKVHSGIDVCCKGKDFYRCHEDCHLKLSNDDQNITNTKDILEIKISGETLKAYTSSSIDNYEQEFLKLYECQGGNLKIKVRGENGMIGNINAKITKTPSGHVALDVRDLKSLGEFSKSEHERPILLKRSLSGKYFLFIGQSSKAPNTVLRRTSSDGALVVITEPVLKSMALDKRCFRSITSNKALKVKIKGIPDNNDIVEPPALLKLTSSGNYILVLDKEFEKQHNNMIKNSLFKNRECYVELDKMSSSTILINFGEESTKKPHEKTHGLLLKSSSDNIKILVNGPIFDNLGKEINESDSKNAFAELLSKIPSYKTGEKNRRLSNDTGAFENLKDLDKDSKKKRIVDIKSSSDTQLYENVKIKLQQREGLWSAPSATLKRTSSGQFAVFMDKDAKKTFINDVKSYLANSSQTTIPVTRTDSGEITIDLTGENKGQRPYERLKITPSGNIYIVVDEKTLKRMESTFSNKSVALKCCKSPEVTDKWAATFCNAKPEECNCIPNKCICRELLERWEYDPNRYKFLLKPMSCDRLKVTPVTCKNKDCNPETCNDSCCHHKKKMQLFLPRVEALDERISSEGPVVSNPNRTVSVTSSKTEQCFFSYLEQYPFQCKTNSTTSKSPDTYVPIPSVHGEPSWPTIFDDEIYNDTETNKTPKNGKSDYWDSTFFLEHQLPYFLRDYIEK